jgi:hypothetical protein
MQAAASPRESALTPHRSQRYDIVLGAEVNEAVDEMRYFTAVKWGV